MKSSILRLLIISGFLLINFAHAGVKSYLDRNEVRTQETFTLTIEADFNTDDTPDLSLIPKELQILGSTKYHHSSLAPGKAEIQLGWKVVILANQAGEFTIPAFALGSEKSSPINLKVEEPTASLTTDDKLEAIMLKSELSKQKVYVQEQVILTVKLYRAVQTQYSKLSENLMIPDAIVERLGDDTQYDTIINNTRFVVLERKFAIFPQKSGELLIPKVVYSADVLQAGSSGYGRILGRTRPITLTTDEQTIEVTPYPKGHSGLWLPSQELTIKSRWSSIGEKVVGEPSTWTITLTGVGLHENQLPAIELPEVDGIKWYPDTAEASRRYSSEGVVGQRVERIAVVPTKSGKLTLPAIKIRWFNVNSERYETATLAAQTITVAADPNTPATTATTPNSILQPVPNTTHTTPSASNDSTWQWLAGIFAGLWLATLALLLLGKPRNSQSPRRSNKPAPLSNKKQQVIAAIREQDPRAVYQSLLPWFDECRGTAGFNQHVAVLQQADAQANLLDLQASLFAENATRWDAFKQLRAQLNNIENDLKRSRQSQPTTAPLPDLYPK